MAGGLLFVSSRKVVCSGRVEGYLVQEERNTIVLGIMKGISVL